MNKEHVKRFILQFPAVTAAELMCIYNCDQQEAEELVAEHGAPPFVTTEIGLPAGDRFGEVKETISLTNVIVGGKAFVIDIPVASIKSAAAALDAINEAGWVTDRFNTMIDATISYQPTED